MILIKNPYFVRTNEITWDRDKEARFILEPILNSFIPYHFVLHPNTKNNNNKTNNKLIIPRWKRPKKLSTQRRYIKSKECCELCAHIKQSISHFFPSSVQRRRWEGGGGCYWTICWRLFCSTHTHCWVEKLHSNLNSIKYKFSFICGDCPRMADEWKRRESGKWSGISMLQYNSDALVNGGKYRLLHGLQYSKVAHLKPFRAITEFYF